MRITPAAARPSPPDLAADRLRALAARVRRLGTAGRTDPEAITVEKLTIAAELARLAHQLEANTA